MWINAFTLTYHKDDTVISQCFKTKLYFVVTWIISNTNR